MAIAGKFEIRVAGRPLSRKSVKDAEMEIDERVRFIDPDVKRETRIFSTIQVIFIWTGKPKKIEESQRLLKYLQSSLMQYFTVWAFSIEINLQEKKE